MLGPQIAIVLSMQRRLPVCGVLIVAAVLPHQVDRRSSILSFFSPTVELAESERTRLRGGRILARVLDAPDQDLAVFAAGALAITPELFVARTQAIGALRRSRTGAAGRPVFRSANPLGSRCPRARRPGRARPNDLSAG
jgi:hypothetical protein